MRSIWNLVSSFINSKYWRVDAYVTCYRAQKLDISECKTQLMVGIVECCKNIPMFAKINLLHEVCKGAISKLDFL